LFCLQLVSRKHLKTSRKILKHPKKSRVEEARKKRSVAINGFGCGFFFVNWVAFSFGALNGCRLSHY